MKVFLWTKNGHFETFIFKRIPAIICSIQFIYNRSISCYFSGSIWLVMWSHMRQFTSRKIKLLFLGHWSFNNIYKKSNNNNKKAFKWYLLFSFVLAVFWMFNSVYIFVQFCIIFFFFSVLHSITSARPIKPETYRIFFNYRLHLEAPSDTLYYLPYESRSSA